MDISIHVLRQELEHTEKHARELREIMGEDENFCRIQEYYQSADKRELFYDYHRNRGSIEKLCSFEGVLEFLRENSYPRDLKILFGVLIHVKYSLQVQRALVEYLGGRTTFPEKNIYLAGELYNQCYDVEEVCRVFEFVLGWEKGQNQS
ncbi:MAG: hypothetical protein K9M99_02845 [Candidatus Cloacimonetes bacterium]|nr:hypothetical protein [Candidatus Cloacimonadota bacterium]